MRTGWALLLTIVAMGLASCASSTPDIDDVAALRHHLNASVGKIVNLDTLLCKHAFGSNGEIYFDDMTWDHLNPSVRKSTVECLDLRKHLRVRALPHSGTMPARVWTARVDDDRHLLTIGWLNGACTACDPDAKVAEYRLRSDANHYVAEDIPNSMIWK